ncbi:MAG: hypothetical protein HY320_15900 [Armatimonadetes bacterium]|nr:hypothetical protein [Armatimonadota bacterium]
MAAHNALRQRVTWFPARPGRPECPVCRRIEHLVTNCLTKLTARLVEQPDERQSFAAEPELCGPHAYQAREYAGNAEIALIYELLIRAYRSQIASRQSAGIPTLYQHPCVACNTRDEAEKQATSGVADLLCVPDLREQFRQTHGLCLPHLDLVCEVASEEVRQFLRMDECERLDRLAEDLARYVRKRYPVPTQEETTDTERTAAGRAVLKMYGHLGAMKR